MSQDIASTAPDLDTPAAYVAPAIQELGSLADLTLGAGGSGGDSFGESSIDPT